MNLRLKQKSTIAGILSILTAVMGVFSGAIDPVAAGSQIAAGIGLIAVNA